MKISGFSMVKNATKLYYPIKASIMSILPIVDEFVVAVGDCDEDDSTRKEIESIGSEKVRIIDTKWDLKKYPNGTENAHQTDIAREACSGDWLFYLQADEVVHEKYLNTIKNRCEQLLDDKQTEGLLFKYVHFWGDYDHYHVAHGWYPKEIRIVRNDPDIHSWESAQSFRRIPGFNYVNYRQQKGTYKLKVAMADAYIYHYGWVRPPSYMQNKKKALDTIHKGAERVEEIYKNEKDEFDYGPLRLAMKFNGDHPAAMKEWIGLFNWSDSLRTGGPIPDSRPRFKHEKLKYRIVTFLEQKVLRGGMIGGFRNYELLKR
ncbi:MAG: hypothetical protein JW894_01400 [Bacteroidales bacterium]|nr:hypothetical protein [Bacteroidales bacterium]